MTPYILFFFLGFLIRSLFSKLLTAYDYIKAMRELELRFLLLTSNYIQWRAQALEALKLTYKYINEDKPEDKELNDAFLAKVEEKYDKIIEEYINGLKEKLPYPTSYNNIDDVKIYISKNMEK